MMNKYNLLIIFLSVGQISISQSNSNNLSTSPYSLYGLGVSNEASTGKTNALGKAGIAMPSNTIINNLNPASYGRIQKRSFLFDVGFIAGRESLFENGIIESKLIGNFSNIAIAFPITEKSSFGFTLLPFTNVGYTISDIETGIDGSTDTFISNINGSGGLNNLNLNYGYAFNDKLSLGVKGSFFFGKIKEEEVSIVANSALNISEESYYNGFRLGLGLQFKLNDKFSIGSIINFPTDLKGSQTRTGIVNENESSQSEVNLDVFKLPLEIGFGIHARLNEQLYFNIDYKRNLWDVTNQSDFTGNFVDQDFIGFGAEFSPRQNNSNYWKRVKYSAGIRFEDTGLLVSGNSTANTFTNIKDFGMSFGLSLPLGRKISSLDLGFEYGKKGTTDNNLLQENYFNVRMSLSLSDLWFVKRRID